MRNGIEVPPRIGDAEQIALLKAEERRANKVEQAAMGDGIEVDITIDSIRSTMSFTCICGREITAKGMTYSSDPDDVDVEYDGYTHECPQCRRRYSIEFGAAKLDQE